MTDTTTNATNGMPQTCGLYLDSDGRLWVFLEAYDHQLLGMDISTALELYCGEKIELNNKHTYRLFAPFTKVKLPDIGEICEEKQGAKNDKNTTSLTEEPTMVETTDADAYKCTLLKGCAIGCGSLDTEIRTTPQGKVVIRCDDCGRMICGDVTEFDDLVKAWNKGSARP